MTAAPTGNDPTLDDVARAAGVSLSTASRVTSGAGPASPEAVARVREAAARLGYRPHPLARGLARRTGTRLVVAAVAPTSQVLADPYLHRTLAAAAAVADAYDLGVVARWLPVDAPGPALERIGADRGVAGVVLLNTTADALAAIPPRLRGRVVSMGVGAPGVPSFDVDNAGTARALVRHLVAHGRRRIAMVTGPPWMPCTHRAVAAYRAVLAQAGLPELAVPGDFTPAGGHAGARAALERWPDLDAVFAASDPTALGVLAALRGAGRRVPGDVALAGSDDLPLAALATPALTTATHPVERIASTAAGAVLDHDPVRTPDWIARTEPVLRESA